MAWIDNGRGEWYWEPDETGSSPPEGSRPSGTPPSSTDNLATSSPTANTADEEFARGVVTEGSPNYRGPGWELVEEEGKTVAKLSSDPEKQMAQLAYEADQAPKRNIAAENPMPVAQAPAQPASLDEMFARASAATTQPQGTALTTGTTSKVTGTRPVPSGMKYNLTGAPTSPAAPKVDRSKIDPLLGGIGTYQNAIWELGQDNTGLSVAEAQLAKAAELARIQAGINTEQSQRSALGAARGARNRGDRALLERQAVGEAAYIGQDAARTQALTEAETRGKLAELRAGEADADRRFRLDAIKEAANLGLNTAALEIDISKANLQSVADTLNRNQAFKQFGLELDQRKAEQAMQYMQAMAAIQYQYDQMSVTDRQETQRLLMQKYQIDETTRVALEKIKADGAFEWDQALIALIGGAGAGATAAIAKPASDERVKTNIQEVDATAAELDELMNALGAYTYEYKEPEKFGDGLRFGFMAQELEGTKLGKHMVQPDSDGTKRIDVGPLALATASGLALVNQRLRELEQAVR